MSPTRYNPRLFATLHISYSSGLYQGFAGRQS